MSSEQHRRRWAAAAGAVLAVGAALWLAARVLSPGWLQAASGSPPQPSADAYEQERDQRSRAVCEQTRARIARGATIGITDVEGWVVELSFLAPGARTRAGVDAEAVLGAFLSAGSERRITWSEAPALASISGPTTRVSVLDQGSGPARQLTLTFHGRYVTPYFSASDRAHWVHLATALRRALGATHAGLYARCEHAQSHQIGGWFYGDTPAAAAAALLLYMGAQAEVPQLAPRWYSPSPSERTVDASFAVRKLSEQARGLTRERLAELISSDNGQIAGRAPETSLHFELSDGNRATRASLALARHLQVAPAEQTGP